MTDIKHSEREHSLWAPSSWDQWANCPASAFFAADFPREDNEHSLRGTWCHEQVEHLFSGQEIDTESEWYEPKNVDQIEFVYEYAKQLIEHCGVLEPPDVYHETTVKLHGYKEVFGTADLIIYDRDEQWLWVVDYKFGYTPVSARRNKQLMMYAAMAKDSLFTFMPVKDIILMIIQPTDVREMVSKDRVTWNELTGFVQSELHPALNNAMVEGAEFVPGEKQCKWCPASGACPAQRDKAIEVFDEFESKREESINYETLLPLLGEMQEFINGVQSQARNKALKGDRIKGYKLVRKVTRSKWRDKEKAEKWLAARGILKPQRTKTTVIGIGDAEKLVWDLIKDKPVLQQNFKKLIHKPEGDLILVPDDDKRPPVEVTDPFEEDII